MLRSMAPRPIVFALSNPDPEIDPVLAAAVCPDVVLATGRSDVPNQVNNVLGFPSVFRGALDVRAGAINDEMKLAAVHALAALAREPVPGNGMAASGNHALRFGPGYLIPKPLDPRVVPTVAAAVAKAAIDSGVARIPGLSLLNYREHLERRLAAGARGLPDPLRA
jgi:malate dehydrogenase (oxaloacetate-decarboxylating)(NADP+)